MSYIGSGVTLPPLRALFFFEGTQELAHLLYFRSHNKPLLPFRFSSSNAEQKLILKQFLSPFQVHSYSFLSSQKSVKVIPDVLNLNRTVPYSFLILPGSKKA